MILSCSITIVLKSVLIVFAVKVFAFLRLDGIQITDSSTNFTDKVVTSPNLVIE